MSHNRVQARASALSENAIQRAVFANLRIRGMPGLIAFHPKNSGSDMRGRRAGVYYGLGVLPGVSDVICFYAGKFYALELKTHGRKPTREQHHFIESVRAAEGMADWADSLDTALQRLETWGLLRGKAA